MTHTNQISHREKKTSTITIKSGQTIQVTTRLRILSKKNTHHLTKKDNT